MFFFSSFVKRGVVFVVILFFFVLLVGAFFFSSSYTGFATGNASFGFQNLAPAWNTIPNQSWPKNTQISLYLNSYSSDPENYSLSYGYTIPKNITVSLSGSNLTLIPDTGFVGNRTIIFSAYDYLSLVYSNTVFLNVNSSSTNTSSSNASSDSGGSSSSSSGGGGGGGGGTTTPVVSNESEEEEERVIYLSPEVSVPCKKDYLFLDDVTKEGFLYPVYSCNTFYLGDKEDLSDGNLAYLYFVFIHKKETFAVVDYTDSLGVLNQILLSHSENVSLDIDGDGIHEYFVRLEDFGEDDSLILYVDRLPGASFALFAPVFQENSLFWYILFFDLVLLCVILYLYRRKLYK